MRKRISFKKALAAALVGHILIGAGMGVASFFDSESHSQSQKEVDVFAQEDYIETYRVDSTMATEAEVASQVEAYKQLVSKNAKQEQKSKAAIAELQRQEDIARSKVKKAESELVKVKNNVNSTNAELRKVRAQKKEESKALAKKLEAEQKQAKVNKAILEKEKKEAEVKAAQLATTRKGNAKLLQEVRANNRALEKNQLAKARGVYERGIHDTLIKNWTLPFMRKRVNCRVELSLTSSGVIQSFKIHKPCDQLYHKSIVTAVEKTAFLPTANGTVFKNKEIVNFIDNSNGVYIR